MELRDRRQIERTFAVKLTRLSAQHRRELNKLLGYPPDINNVPPEFWEKVKRELEEQAAAALLLIFMDSATQHGLSPKWAKEFAEEFAQERAEELARDYAKYSQEVLQRAEIQWRKAEPKKGEVAAKTVEIFGPTRNERIAVTETTTATTAGGETAVDQVAGLQERDLWFTIEDGKRCKVCRKLHLKPRSVWSKLFPKGPPAHSSCRCKVKYRAEKTGEVKPFVEPKNPHAKPLAKEANKAKLENGREIEFQRHEAGEMHGDALVSVDPKKFEAAWKQGDGEMFLPASDTSRDIGSRRAGFERFLQENPEKLIQAPRVDLSVDGGVTVIDGRHRSRVLLNQNVSRMVISVPRSEAKKVAKLLDGVIYKGRYKK